jgi:hypothetical protein
MRKYVLFGIGRLVIPVPRFVFMHEVNKTRPVTLPDDHHRVRDFAVKEIPVVGKPLAPTYIGESLGLAQDRLASILDELEKGMTFLWRGDGENVTWAYPVTVDETPHRYTFNTGETGNAA